MHSKFHSFSSIVLTASISMLLATSSVIAAENKNLQKNMKPETQSPPKPKWEQEPSSFMGIELGRPLSISSFARCPKFSWAPDNVDFVEAAKLGKLCLNKERENGTYTIYGFQVPPLKDNAKIKTLDNAGVGAVGNFKIVFNSNNFPQVKEMLTIKYGSPHKIEIEKLKTKGGDEFDNIVLFWSGENVFIRADSLFERSFVSGSIYEMGEINVFTNDYLSKKSDERNDIARKSAAGL